MRILVRRKMRVSRMMASPTDTMITVKHKKLFFLPFLFDKKEEKKKLRLTESQPRFLNLQVNLNVCGQPHVGDFGALSSVLVVLPVAVPDPCNAARNVFRIHQ